ncbi:pyruvate kinase alpha/beta domain-containing protein [Chloroflexota bacterium]
MEEKITYFEESGPDNTEETLKLAVERAKARGIKKIVLASTRGDTARLAAERYADSGIKLVVIPHQYGFGEAQRFPPELVDELAKKGHRVHFGTMLFHTENFYGSKASTTLANMLRVFCQGMKVCFEIVLMAADGGCVDIGEQVVAVSGSGRGSDTAVVAIASTSTKFNEFHLTEIICKPLQTRTFSLGDRPPAPRNAPAQTEKK